MKTIKNLFIKLGLIKEPEPKRSKRPKDRYRIYARFDSDGNKIIRPNGLGFGLWGGNEKIIVQCLNNF